MSSTASQVGLLPSGARAFIEANIDSSSPSLASSSSSSTRTTTAPSSTTTTAPNPLMLKPRLTRNALPWSSGESSGLSARSARAHRLALEDSIDKEASMFNMKLTPMSSSASSNNNNNNNSKGGGGADKKAEKIVVGPTALARIEQSFAPFSKITRLGVRAAINTVNTDEDTSSGDGDDEAVSRLAALAEAAREASLFIKLRPSEIAAIKAAVIDGTVPATRARLPYARAPLLDPTTRVTKLSVAATHLGDYIERNRLELIDRARGAAFQGVSSSSSTSSSSSSAITTTTTTTTTTMPPPPLTTPSSATSIVQPQPRQQQQQRRPPPPPTSTW